jgi:flagellar motor switch protein FliN
VSASGSNSGFARFIESWRQGLTQALSEAGLKAVKAEFVDAKTCADRVPKAGEKSYRLGLNGSGSVKGTLKFITSETEALQLSLLLKPAAEKGTAQFGDKERDLATELICRAAAKFTPLWGRDNAKLDIAPANTAMTGPETICGGLRMGAENFGPVTLLLAPSAEFVPFIREPGTATVAAPAMETPKGAPTMPTSQSTETNSNLGLLFNVQLEATIRFGGRQLLLRDILSLSPGSVIELDRQVSDPAELLVAGRLVARGEVVVVDGNFGLRVTELTNTSQRSELVQA